MRRGCQSMGTSSQVVSCRIFINYRREDTAYPAGWLFDRLTQHFGKGQIFKDIDSIHLGDDFVEAMTTAVGSCDVLLALIGDRWTSVTDKDGGRRIDNPGDYVRMEIEAALKRDTLVIPILVGGAEMPTAGELPPSLAKLVRRNALELSPSRFDADAGRLLAVLDETLARAGSPPEQTSAPTGQGPGQGPDKEPDKEPDRPPRHFSRWAILAGAAAGAALIVAGAIVLLIRPHPATPAGAPSASVLLRDDFSSMVNGWRVVTGGSGGYGHGGYRISVPPLNDAAIAVPGKARQLMSASAPQNLSIEATGHTSKNPGQDDLYGIACRQGSWGAYLFLMGDQAVYLEKWLGPYSAKHDSPIIYLNLKAAATNHLRAVCTTEGPRAVRLTFWVNGQQVADWTDTQSPFTSGTVGLVNASLSSTKPTEAQFSNVVVGTATGRRAG
jgi:hypothetical protein